ncbi:pre-mRNA-splicing factor Slu7 [Condylostylus longicornis]|uniref:pre-mRNA-splicing factor Slu7 n=1 Tax=Condylostylus longicornis TaxID=2530218 RepID=UPI00244DF475|nr:pre-mRNA-splicing factor Slu7 [Condylostylus longicornis]
MSSGSRVVVSQVIRHQTTEEEPKKKSREDWRKAKELDEARKAGTAPAAVDEEGKDINPHIPQYIANAPWYYGAAGPTLKHQRPQHISEEDESKDLSVIPKKGTDLSKVITKYRKGACENCGAMTHKKKDCLERPRKIGAKYAEVVVAYDEHIPQKNDSDYDQKRDRWNDYDPACHKEIVEEFEKVEEAKRQLKASKLQSNPEVELSDEAEEDEDKYADDFDMPGTKVDSKQRITVRNLRIREDTAKYLRNLDPNSAYYDPKTRSMRDNPNPDNTPEQSEFAGENFVRFTGDTQKHTKAQLFAWEAHEKGVDIHLLAEPTKLELLQSEYDKKKEQFKSQTKNQILEKYGGDEHLKAPPKSLLLAQTEEYIEYSRSGKVVRGQEKQKVKSIYEEDVLINNHTSIWGSFWDKGMWGYKCCYSFVKNSYCVGNRNMHTADVDQSNNSENLEKSDKIMSETSFESHRKKLKKPKHKKKEKTKEKDYSEKTIEELEEEQNLEHLMELNERKRKFNSMYENKAPTEEEMEEFMKKRQREEDPMLSFVK